MKQIKEKLKTLGLSDLEIDIYLRLLADGSSSLSRVARLINKPKTTVFDNTKKLLDKGLVVKSVKGKKYLLTAKKPEVILALISKRESSLVQEQHAIEQVKVHAPELIMNINEMVGTNYEEDSESNFKLYEGKKEVFNIYTEVLDADEVFSFANLENYYKIFPGTEDLWVEAFRKNPNREYWDILVDSEMAREIDSYDFPRYHFKIMPGKTDDSYVFSDCLIYNDKVAMIQLNTKNTVASVIESKHISNSLIAIHKTVWNLLPEK